MSPPPRIPAPGLPDLARGERERYARHLLLPEVGLEGQRRLKAARVLCVGAGGLGSPVALYLAAAGIGTLSVVDPDAVEVTNLQRQVLHATPDVGRPKVESAAARLRALNPHVEVRPIPERLGAGNALGLLRGHDVVVDGTDNFATRYVLNDAALTLGLPVVHGSVYRFEGQASVFGAPGGPCYRCLHPEPPPAGLVPSCAEGGVLGVLPGLLGTIQAAETLKLVLGRGETLAGRLLVVDALAMRFREVRLRRDPACPSCGEGRRPAALVEPAPACADAGAAPEVPEISVEELRLRQEAGAAPPLLDVREPHEAGICTLGGRLIPLGDLPGRLGELDPSLGWVVYCRSGRRSARAVALLRDAGFAGARNLAGGVLAWAERIDPRMARY
jgi:adenylyltransferase/sulfurtransferase